MIQTSKESAPTIQEQTRPIPWSEYNAPRLLRASYTVLLGDFGIYVLTATLSVVIFACLLQLNKANFSIPLSFGWDANFNAMLVKNLVLQGHYNVNPLLGAPGYQELYDFPLPHALHVAVLEIVHLASNNFGVVLNAYFVLTFALCSLTSLYVFRTLKFAGPASVVCSILYAFLPYHLIRAEYHLTYSSYYIVPLMVLVSLWVCDGERLFVEGRRFLPTRRGVFSALVCGLIASDHPYNAFFGAFFLSVAGILGRFRYGHRNAIRTAALLLTLISTVFALNLAPNIIYKLKHGANPQVAIRNPHEAEVFGLKLAQLILPLSGHRVPAFATLKEKYNTFQPWTEADAASLGVLDSIGFIWLLASLFVLKRVGDSNPLREKLALLNLAGVLLGTIGGIGSLFALLISPQLRSYNRISVFIAFFSFLAIGSISEQFLARRSRSPLIIAMHVVLAALVLLLGILDQTPKHISSRSRDHYSSYLSDGDFVHQIEKSVPVGAMIFQLPYVPFPENPGVDRMGDYDHLRGFLHSDELRWSYGAMRGRETDLWQKSVAAEQPLRQMVKTMALAGFAGIYVDRYGYQDGARDLESNLAEILREKPLVSRDQRLSFFNLEPELAELRRDGAQREWQSETYDSLHPILMNWLDGCWSLEGKPDGDNWRWCSPNGALGLLNLSSSIRKVTLEMELATGYADMAHVRITSAMSSSDLNVSRAGKHITLNLDLPPGASVIRFSSDARRVDAPSDPRFMVFRINNFRMIERSKMSEPRVK